METEIGVLNYDVKQKMMHEFEEHRRQARKVITSFVSCRPQWENMTIT